MIVISLPFPDASLNPNRKNGKHWGATHGAKDKARSAAYYVTLSQSHRIGFEPSRLQITYIAPDKLRRDLDNLLASSKPSLDGICMALGIDDHCFEEVVLRRGYRKGIGEMIVEIS